MIFLPLAGLLVPGCSSRGDARNSDDMAAGSISAKKRRKKHVLVEEERCVRILMYTCTVSINCPQSVYDATSVMIHHGYVQLMVVHPTLAECHMDMD